METNLGLAVKQLYVESKHDKDNYLCEVFVVYPEDKEVFGGYLSGIVEMRATPRVEANKIVQTMINTIREKYYGQIKASPDPQKLNLETVFEYSLQKTNEALTDLVQIGHIDLDLDNLHYLISIARPKQSTKEIEMFFAHSGLVFAHLIHRTKQGNYKVIDIAGNSSDSSGAHDKIKIFSSILSGNVFYHDTVYFCSELFNNYIPPQKVNKIFGANDFDASMDYFKGLINNVQNNSYMTHAALFLRLEEKKIFEQSPISQKSIAKMVNTEDATKKFLMPTFALDIKGHLSKLKSVFKKDKQKSLSVADDRSSLKKIMNKIPFGKTAGIAGIVPRGGKKKIFIALFALALVIAGGTFFYLKKESDAKKALAAYQTQLKDIQTQINTAEAYYIAGNEAQSRDLLKTVEAMIPSLPQTTTNEISNVNTLNEQVKSVNNRLQKMEKVAPELVAELPGDASVLEISDKNALVASGANLIVVNTVDRKIEKTIVSAAGELAISTNDEKKIYFFTKTGKVLGFDPATMELKEKTLTLGSIAPASMQIYNGKLYIVDNKTIYKGSAIEGGFSALQKWVTDTAALDFTGAADLTIDGNIYVLSNNGGVLKFLSGASQPFTMPAIDPALSSASKIYTTVDLKFFYILDSGSKRIVLISKEGKLIKQYSFEAVPDAITDFAIQENTTYFVAKNKLYKAELR